MTGEKIKVGSRVRLHSGNDVGTVTATWSRFVGPGALGREVYRAQVRWDSGQYASWLVSDLVLLADEDV